MSFDPPLVPVIVKILSAPTLARKRLEEEINTLPCPSHLKSLVPRSQGFDVCHQNNLCPIIEIIRRHLVDSLKKMVRIPIYLHRNY